MSDLPSYDRAAAAVELAAAMNHEHGNLLAALKAWIEAPALGMPAAEALGQAAKVVEKMQRLQRAEQLCVAGLRNEQTETVALAELLDHALALASPRLRARGVLVSVEQPEAGTTVHCNPGRAVAEIFFLMLRVAGFPKDERRTLIVSADPFGNEIRLTAFLDHTPNVRETLAIPGVVGK